MLPAVGRHIEARRDASLPLLSEHSAEALRDMISRLVDPWPVVKSHVYDGAFQGSFSIKAVAPALRRCCRADHGRGGSPPARP